MLKWWLTSTTLIIIATTIGTITTRTAKLPAERGNTVNSRFLFAHSAV
jgi:hypothetical protein